MARLYLKCKTCGIEFVSGIDLDKESFESTTFVDNYHVCPNQHSNSYNKQDYYFK